MKQIVNFFVVAAIAVSVAFVGCKKDDKEVIKLVSTITQNNGNYFAYEYDEKNRIIYEGFYASNGNIISSFTFTYSGNDLVKAVTNVNVIREFAKTGNTINVTRTTDGNSEFVQSFFLNNDGLVIGSDFQQQDDVYTFQYQGKNLSKFVNKRNEETISDIDYLYDDKKSPFYHCKSPQWSMIMFFGGTSYGYYNNIIEVNYNPSIRNYSYEFDDDGYPTEMKTRVHNNEILVASFSYISK